MNRYNLEDSNFWSMSERPLEARNFLLWNPFWFIPIRFPVSEISSREDKGNFWFVYYLGPCRLLGPLARTSSHWPISNSRPAWDAIPRKIYSAHFQEKTNYGNFESLYLGNRSRYRDEPKTDLNCTISPIFRNSFDYKLLLTSLVFLYEIYQSFIHAIARGYDSHACCDIFRRIEEWRKLRDGMGAWNARWTEIGRINPGDTFRLRS